MARAAQSVQSLCSAAPALLRLIPSRCAPRSLPLLPCVALLTSALSLLEVSDWDGKAVLLFCFLFLSFLFFCDRLAAQPPATAPLTQRQLHTKTSTHTGTT